jgi:phosphatidate cytidylyltransferase
LPTGQQGEPGIEGEPGMEGEPGIGGGPGSGGGRKPVGAGRNLPAALAVGLALGAIALLTLFTIKVLFLVVVAVAITIALWELTRALRGRDIRLPLVPVAAGGLAMMALAYWRGERPLVAALAVTVIAVMSWRLPGGTEGYLRDVAAGLFALAYLMVPKISPRKTWEGSAGSALACLVAGAILLPTLLHAPVWQGVALGAAAVTAAILGDLSESMIKRDLEVKDMGTVLPGHGGVLDRIDAMLVCAPVVWLLLVIFLS